MLENFCAAGDLQMGPCGILLIAQPVLGQSRFTQSRTASGGIHWPSFLHDLLRKRHQYTLRGQQGGGGQIQKLMLPVGS